MKAFSIFILCFMFLFPISGTATNLFVSSTYGTDTNTGLSWETAKSNLQSLVNLSGQGNVYNIGAGTYQMTNLHLAIPANNTFIGTNRETVVWKAAASTRVVLGLGSNIAISSVSITGGNLAAGSGAGILGKSEANSIVVSNCLVYSNYCRRYNSADRGAGIRYGIVSDSEIFGNVANYHGGGLATCIVSNSAVYNNAVTGNAYGGGVEACTIYNSRVYSNTAARGGGGNSGTFYDSQIYGNYAWNYQGGGTYNSTLYRCAVSNNWSVHNGGGCYGGSVFGGVIISNYSETLGGGLSGGVVSNCIVVSNSSASSGGGLNGATAYNSLIAYNRSTASSGGGANISYLYSCVIASNVAHTAYDAVGAARELFNCTIVGHTNKRVAVSTYLSTEIAANNIIWNNFTNSILGSTNQFNNFTNDPLFLSSSYKLQASSPCIDAGDDFYATMPLDYYGRGRIYGSHVDIGAAEWYSEDVPVVIATGRKRALLSWFLWAY